MTKIISLLATALAMVILLGAGCAYSGQNFGSLQVEKEDRVVSSSPGGNGVTTTAEPKNSLDKREQPQKGTGGNVATTSRKRNGSATTGAGYRARAVQNSGGGSPESNAGQSQTGDSDEDQSPVKNPVREGETAECGRLVNIAGEQDALDFFAYDVEVCQGLYDMYKLFAQYSLRMNKSIIAAGPKGEQYYEQTAWLPLDSEGSEMTRIVNEDFGVKSNEAYQAFKNNNPAVNNLISQARGIMLGPYLKAIIAFETKWGVGSQN